MQTEKKDKESLPWEDFYNAPIKRYIMDNYGEEFIHYG